MAVLQIVKYPSKILRQKCRPVLLESLFPDSPAEPELLRWMTDMEDTLHESDGGAALAANQIGIDARMFVTNQGLTARHGSELMDRELDPVVYGIPPFVINPEIVERSQETELLDEGCLSFPGIFLRVRRHRWVTIEYTTVLKIDGRWKVEGVKETYRFFWAQVFQHEIDHLDGKLFVDSLSEKKKYEIISQIGKARRK